MSTPPDTQQSHCKTQLKLSHHYLNTV